MNAIVEKSYNIGNLVENDTCCDNPRIFTTIQGLVCRNCGTCLGPEMVETERRAVTSDEIKKRRQTETVWSKYANRTFISNQCTNKFYRLNKINNNLIGQNHGLVNGEKGVKEIARAMNLSPVVRDTALVMMARAMKQKLARGRSIPGLAAASILLASRVHAYPTISIDDMLKAIQGINCHLVLVSLRLIKENVLPELGYQLKHTRDDEIRELMMKFGIALEIPTSDQLKAIALFKSACENGYGKYIVGKSPVSIASACLYVASDYINQDRLCEACGTTSVTLRNQVKSLMEFLKKNNMRLVEEAEPIIKRPVQLARDANVETGKKTIKVSKTAMRLILDVFKASSSMLTASEVSCITGTNINGTKAVIAALYKNKLLERVPVGNEILWCIPSD